MSESRSTRSRFIRVALSALCGGYLCGNCQTTFRDAAVSGARTFLFDELLNPANFPPAVAESDDPAESDQP
jgi:hypothetical protein